MNIFRGFKGAIMNRDLIKFLMETMRENDLTRLALKEEGFEIELERSFGCSSSCAPTPVPAQVFHPAVEASIEKDEQEDGHIFIESPMVGTFYSSSSPDDDPFVKVGDLVSEDTVVGIIEAMKVMNEIKAGVNGTVEEFLIQDGKPVEFGTKIMRVV